MKLVKRLLLSLVLIVLLLEAYQLSTDDTSFTSALANALFNSNLHEVVPGKLFRSAEMSSDDLLKVVQNHGIKTVLDLRLEPKPIPVNGPSEEETLDKLGVHYVHIPLMGSKEMEPAQIQQLFSEFDKAQTPILVHCSSGTHRSGVVSAMWMMDKDGIPYEIASDQLSPKYGFFLPERKLKGLIDGHPTIDNVLWRYAKGRKSMTFRQWVDAGMPESP